MPPRLPEIYDDDEEPYEPVQPEAVVEEYDGEDVDADVAEFDDELPEDEMLVATTVEQMTERLTVLELEEVEQAMATKAQSERISEQMMAPPMPCN